jgi:prepilin-type processing-associated H-X9-DG protein
MSHGKAGVEQIMAEIDYPDDRFGSAPSGIVQFVFLDGHVDALATDMAIPTLMGLSTIGGSEVLQR